MTYLETHLWQNTLADQSKPDPAASSREHLRSIFSKFRERAGQVAGEIARDLPEFTVHDGTHLDALWEMADLITGDAVSFTPMEAFVLGGAFLTHDLGMGLAALPEGRDGLRADPNWSDLIAANLRRQNGRTPTAEEIASPAQDVEREVLSELLRQRHAQRAEHVVGASYGSGAGNDTYHMIEDPELRRSLGSVIGRIAYSHWWSLERVQEEFANRPALGAPIGYPSDWTVDQLKLACLLRIADAIHIDGRRAPGFLRALRKPEGYADLHWTFQQNVHQPQRKGERIEFTSGHRFTATEARAWWVGYELIQTADHELGQVDALLQDVAKYRFAARSVAGSQDPSRLSKYIQVESWRPVDARVQVTDVAALVRNIGGAQLYGNDRTVPLRELIQNGCDAVRARRLLEDREEDWGTVTVRLGQDETGSFVEVEDTGVGMSEVVLSGPFLDFGKSFWNTPLMHSELPGLEGKRFVSTGQYGIGFFSVFMWGTRVIVTTHPCREGGLTSVLEFAGEVGSRPLVRQAKAGETVRDRGTRVRVYVDEQQDLLQFLAWSSFQGRDTKLKELCAWLCPSLDVTLRVQQQGEPVETAVQAADWQTLEPRELLRRIWGPLNVHESDPDLGERVKQVIATFAQNVRPIVNSDGRMVGRACLAPRIMDNASEFERSLITIGGMRATPMTALLGLLDGRPLTAARNDAMPTAEPEVMERWATEQADLLEYVKPEGRQFTDMQKVFTWARIIRRLAGRIAGLPIFYRQDGWLNAADLRKACVNLDEVLCPMGGATLDDAEQWSPFLNPQQENYETANVRLNNNVFYTTRGGHLTSRINGGPGSSYDWPTWISEADYYLGDEGKSHVFGRVVAEVVDVLAEAWGVSVESIAKSSPGESFGTDPEVKVRGASQRWIGTLNGIDLYGSCYVWYRPKPE